MSAAPDFDVFVSYNTLDHAAVERIGRALQDRGLTVFLDRWELVPGRPWPDALEGHLARCRAAAVVLGPSGMGPWQQREHYLALDRQARDTAFGVIPVILPSADPALGFLSLNTWVDLQRGVDDAQSLDLLAAAVRGEAPAALLERTRQAAAQVCPYRGLEVFREEDAPFFFGREDFTKRLKEAVAARPLVAVVGASGSGKSSVVRAGLVPSLRRADGKVWEVVTLVPGDRPFYSLSAALLPLLEPEMSERKRLVEIGEMTNDLAQGRLALRDVVERVVEKQRGTDRLLLVVDQWEELYTYAKADKAKPTGAAVTDEKVEGDKAREISTRFIDEVLTATEAAPLTVVLTLRADFYGEALTHRALSDRLQAAQVNLGPMTREELERAISEPAKKAGLEFDVGLVDRLLDDVGEEPGNLPLLEFALKQLWSARRGNRLQYEVYKSIGGVKGAIARRAEDVYAKLDKGQQGTAERVFTKLVRPGDETGDTRRRRALTDFDAAGRALIRTLAGPDARLLITGRVEGTDQETVEVAHEALIREWDRMGEWVGKVRRQLKDEAMLEDLAHAWDEHGGGLASVRQLRDFRRVEEPSELAQRYLRASRSRARMRLVGVAAFVALSLAGAWAGAWYFSSAHLEWNVTASDGREVPDHRVSLSHTAEEIDYQGAWWRRWFLKPGTDYWLKVHADGYYEWSDAIRIPTADATRVYIVTLVPEDPARNMVPVERGCFAMGSDKGGDAEQPPHEVCLAKSFRIGRTEVTFAEYQRFARAKGLAPPEDQGWGRGSRPVIHVTWEDAAAYAHWLSEDTGRRYRLPTEAEWEYAARAGTLTTYWWGDDITENGKVWANCDGCGSWWDNDRTAPVGAFDANAFGLRDTAGNVWEWVQDCWHDSYEGAPPDGSAWEEEANCDSGRRVVRGGSWYNNPGSLRSAYRDWGLADPRSSYLGFRLAQDL